MRKINANQKIPVRPKHWQPEKGMLTDLLKCGIGVVIEPVDFSSDDAVGFV
jgi:hypothetical protein